MSACQGEQATSIPGARSNGPHVSRARSLIMLCARLNGVVHADCTMPCTRKNCSVRIHAAAPMTTLRLSSMSHLR